MNSWVERRRKELPEPPAFAKPGNVVFVDGEAKEGDFAKVKITEAMGHVLRGEIAPSKA